MTIWGTFALALVSILGHSAGYSLTLAGVAGLVVSLGITADSYIVFYERLKDEVRRGKTPRSAIQPAFKRAFRTIITADVVTALAAGILYLLAIGSVRGFALTVLVGVIESCMARLRLARVPRLLAGAGVLAGLAMFLVFEGF